MSPTGRNPNDKPALQNIPVRTELGEQVRVAHQQREAELRLFQKVASFIGAKVNVYKDGGTDIELPEGWTYERFLEQVQKMAPPDIGNFQTLPRWKKEKK